MVAVAVKIFASGSRFRCLAPAASPPLLRPRCFAPGAAGHRRSGPPAQRATGEATQSLGESGSGSCLALLAVDSFIHVSTCTGLPPPPLKY